jgi:hypothetical protein
MRGQEGTKGHKSFDADSFDNCSGQVTLMDAVFVSH